MHLSVPFSEIPEHGLHLELADTAWFPDEEITRTGTISTELDLSKKGESKIELRGRVSTTVRLSCDRCLEEFAYTIDSPIQLILEVPDPSHHWHVQDLELGETDIETVVLDKPVVEIGDLLRQQVLLALPEKKLCSDGCLGLCNQCGMNMNKEKCQCRGEEVTSPFAVLAQLKDTEK